MTVRIHAFSALTLVVEQQDRKGIQPVRTSVNASGRCTARRNIVCTNSFGLSCEDAQDKDTGE